MTYMDRVFLSALTANKVLKLLAIILHLLFMSKCEHFFTLCVKHCATLAIETSPVWLNAKYLIKPSNGLNLLYM